MSKKLFVGNLPYSTTEDDLRTLFAEVGTVVSVSLISDRATGQARGFGFVEMDSEQAASEAIRRLNGRELRQRNITVSEARPPRERSFGGDRGGGGRDRDRRGGGRDRDRRGGGGRDRF
jgi:RNA recognition motif-containing protein